MKKTQKKNNKNLIKFLIIYSKKNQADILCLKHIKKFKIDLKTVCSSDFRKENLKKKFKHWNGDYIIHLSSYYKLCESDLSRAKFAINFHPSSPKYPGSGGYSKAIYNLDKNFGITAHFMNKKIDNGKIIKYFSFKLSKNLTLKQLINKTNNHKFYAFKKILSLILKPFADEILLKLAKKNKYYWSKKRGTIRDIDNLQKITPNTSKEKLHKVIKSTMIGRYKPYIKLHGYKFEIKL